MKRILLACLLLSLTAMTVFAEISRTLNYQGRIMDASGNPVPDSTPTNITINLWNDPTSTNASNLVWTNSYAGTATKSGYFNLVFTGGYPAFSGINFDQQLYVGIVLNGGAEMMPRQLLNASASAMTVADGSIANNKLVAGAVGTTTIANGAVTSAKIAASTITGGNIAASTIGGGNIAASTITGGNIAGQTITGANIANSTITQTQAPFAPGVIVGGTWRTGAFIQAGTVATDSGGGIDVSYPVGYTAGVVPVVVVSASTDPNSPQFGTVTYITNTGFHLSTYAGGTKTGPIGVQWIAIGY